MPRGLSKSFTKTASTNIASETNKFNDINNNNSDRDDSLMKIGDDNDNDIYLYSVTFNKKPINLKLKAFDINKNIGAIVTTDMYDITKGSRIMEINNKNCKKFKYNKIKSILNDTILPCVIKFQKIGGYTPILSPNLIKTRQRSFENNIKPLDLNQNNKKKPKKKGNTTKKSNNKSSNNSTKKGKTKKNVIKGAQLMKTLNGLYVYIIYSI